MLLLDDHIDLRVRDLAEARPFYEVLLPALGFTRKTEIPNWVTYAAAAPDNGPAIVSTHAKGASCQGAASRETTTASATLPVLRDMPP